VSVDEKDDDCRTRDTKKDLVMEVTMQPEIFVC
jgi:hypothetical protein